MGNSSSTHTRRRRETTTSTGVRGSVSRAPRRASQMIPDQFTTHTKSQQVQFLYLLLYPTKTNTSNLFTYC